MFCSIGSSTERKRGGQRTPSVQSYVRSDRRSEENKPIKALFSPTEEGKKRNFSSPISLVVCDRKTNENWNTKLSETTTSTTMNESRRCRHIYTIRRQTGRGEAKVENVQRRKTKHLAWAFIDLTIKQCWARFFFSSKYFSYIHNTTQSTQRVREDCEEGNFPFSAFTSLWYFFSYSSFSFFLFQNKSRQSLMDIFTSFLQRNGWIEVGVSVAIYLAFFSFTFSMSKF